MPKRAFISQSNYIPWKGYFDAINLADTFIILDEVQFTKHDWRNRNRIVTPQGIQWLTIPVFVKDVYNQTINETRISAPNWTRKHWGSFQANYAKAPHFRRYAERFETLYCGLEETLLSRVNERFILEINEILGIGTHILRCEALAMIEGKNRRLIDLCAKVGADTYLSGPAARAYLDESRFAAAGIEVEWLDYSGYPEYPQMWDGFEHGVTILDLLFNTGPDAHRYMKSFG
ncbi:MAG: WbqC family protein [Xanthomonadales bacterium]|nr:WbqC family protein [Xanthomonadales bacterium]